MKAEFYEVEIMDEKKGLLVYPVKYEIIPNGFKQIHLCGLGVFFTDTDEGLKYQEQMNAEDDGYNFWDNYLIPYVMKV